jgi:hypothetical protein
MENPGVSGLVEFCFESTATVDLPPAVFLRLARHSSLYNIVTGLTGRLAFDGLRFAATIEGPCDSVLPLAARILADRRHGDIRTTAFQMLATRRYVDWSVEGFELDGTEAAFAENLRPVSSAPRRRRVASASIHWLGSRTA